VIVRASLDTAARRLYLAVKDTGAGADAQTLQHHRGIGLANVERRLRAHFDERATLKIETAKGRGLTVELSIPLQQAELDLVATEAFAVQQTGRSR
jgi:sensor histidine kinase YesM